MAWPDTGVHSGLWEEDPHGTKGRTRARRTEGPLWTLLGEGMGPVEGGLTLQQCHQRSHLQRHSICFC